MFSYRFKVYPVDNCPKNSTEFQTAARRRNCTENSRYLCAPDKTLTSLIEFCTDQRKSLYGKGMFAMSLIMFHKLKSLISCQDTECKKLKENNYYNHLFYQWPSSRQSECMVKNSRQVYT